MNGTTIGFRISSMYLCVFKWPTIKCNCVRHPELMTAHNITPLPPWGTVFTMLASANHSLTWRHTCSLWLLGLLGVLPNSIKLCWRLIVEKWRFNYLATALVDIPQISMPITHFLKTWEICGIVLCDKSGHFRVVFYCPQHKVQLCNHHAV
jgi:hypothetical protein